jgi:hypothetical protein
VVDKYVDMAPKVGMNFDCEEKTYEMHNTYTVLVDFSVRKSRTKCRKSYDSLSLNILFAVAKDIGKMRHHKWILQGLVVMRVSSLVSARRIYGLRDMGRPDLSETPPTCKWTQ